MNILIIGHFGGKEKFVDGQTVKTKTLYEALTEKGKFNIFIADTYFARKSINRFFIELFFKILKADKIIVLLSRRGRKIIFPLLYACIFFFKKEIYHYAIGGNLAIEAMESVIFKKIIKSFSGNWVESRSLALKLANLGIKNSKYVPNFKKITPIEKSRLNNNFSIPYRVCTFSRVNDGKGIGDAIDAIKEMNINGIKYILDIYGPVDDAYKSIFAEKLKKTNEFCRYCGIVSPEDSVEILSNYFVLLFPTKYKSEGIPGTIIDAFSAGIPVIGRKWQYIDEMIIPGKTGYSYAEAKDLPEILARIYQDPKSIINMKLNCLDKAKEYDRDAVIKTIIGELKKEKQRTSL